MHSRKTVLREGLKSSETANSALTKSSVLKRRGVRNEKERQMLNLLIQKKVIRWATRKAQSKRLKQDCKPELLRTGGLRQFRPRVCAA